MPEKISVVKESGETVSSNIVSVFTIPDTEKKYIITTENSVDPHGLTVLHVSEIVDGSLKKIATDEEWSSIKTIMRAIISGNVGSYKYLPAIEAIKAEGQYSRDISVSASASKQMIDNYNAADTSAAEETSEGSNIFPEAEGTTDEDNEVVPGISEVAEEAKPAETAESKEPTTDAPAAETPAVETPAPEAEAITEEPATTAPAAPAVEEPATDAPAAETPAPEAEAITDEPAAPAPEAPAVEEPATDAPEAPAPVIEVVPSEPATTAPEAPAPVEAVPAVSETPAVTEPATTDTPQIEVVPTTVEATPTPVEAAPALSNDIQVVSEQTPPIEVVPTVEQPAAQPATIVQPEVVQTPVVVPTPVEAVSATPAAPEVVVVPTPTAVQPAAVPEQVVQVAQPTQVVPTAQIVQGVPESNLTPPVQFDQNVNPSFKPDATLDEVVKGAQDMFMEGVKNLVQTIQEKVYRDLYIKEAEMKKREALVAQKEQMLNTQFATMMSNITANFNGIVVPPVDPGNTTNPQG